MDKVGVVGILGRGQLLLDRDYRSVAECVALEGEMAARSVNVHVWRKKELESYLLIPSVLSRVSGAPTDEISALLDSVVEGLFAGVEAQFVKLGIQSKPKSQDLATAAQRSIAEFKANWVGLDAKLAICPAKEVISGVNGLLQAGGYKTVTARSLASEVRPEELDPEFVQILSDLEFTLSGTG